MSWSYLDSHIKLILIFFSFFAPQSLSKWWWEEMGFSTPAMSIRSCAVSASTTPWRRVSEAFLLDDFLHATFHCEFVMEQIVRGEKSRVISEFVYHKTAGINSWVCLLLFKKKKVPLNHKERRFPKDKHQVGRLTGSLCDQTGYLYGGTTSKTTCWAILQLEPGKGLEGTVLPHTRLRERGRGGRE